MSDERPWHTFDSEGRCIAWLRSLAPGTVIQFHDKGQPTTVGGLYELGWSDSDALVVVVAWPEGSSPEAPEPSEWFEVWRSDGMERRSTEAEVRELVREPGDSIVRVLAWPGSVIRQEVKP